MNARERHEARRKAERDRIREALKPGSTSEPVSERERREARRKAESDRVRELLHHGRGSTAGRLEAARKEEERNREMNAALRRAAGYPAEDEVAERADGGGPRLPGPTEPPPESDSRDMNQRLRAS
jgi:hypothetical protein